MAKLHERPLRIFRPLSQHLEARQPAAGRQWDHLPAPDRPEPRRPLRPHEPHGGIEPGQAADARRVYLRAPAHHHRALRKKKIALAWQKEQDTLLAGFPAKRLAFTYQDEHQTAMFELHIFSLGRNEGRGCGSRCRPQHRQTCCQPLRKCWRPISRDATRTRSALWRKHQPLTKVRIA